jgi:hypothetical protein
MHALIAPELVLRASTAAAVPRLTSRARHCSR